jgi:hypothetical protein
VQVEEQLLRLGRRGKELRPFCQSAGVHHRGCSRPLQRVLVDFGAEHSFAQAAQRVQEHYGIEVSPETIRQQTLKHGRAMRGLPQPGWTSPANTLISQMDGSMIPVMQAGCGPDARKGKELFWREARLCMARKHDSAQGLYGATLGSAQAAGWLWQEVTQAAGLCSKTYVHGLGDGADWIVDQFQENFRDQGRYLLDFYHVSEYLAAAAHQIARPGKEASWRRRQQNRLLENQLAKVLRSLAPHLEPPHSPETPVRTAHQYLSQRRSHLDYAGARVRQLPIGSGEIESAHRHVIQQRLKLSGCWWKETNAQAMLNVRVARANGLWDLHWSAVN